MKNNKGFMMAEVIVVAAVVLLTLSTLYISYSKIYSAYKARINYYDVSTLYKLAYYRDKLIDDDTFNDLLKTAKEEKMISINNTDRGDKVFLIYSHKKNVYNNLFDNNADIKKTFNVNQTYKDYAKYIYDAAELNANYAMILESCINDSGTVDNDNCKYAYLEIYDGYEGDKDE